MDSRPQKRPRMCGNCKTVCGGDMRNCKRRALNTRQSTSNFINHSRNATVSTVTQIPIVTAPLALTDGETEPQNGIVADNGLDDDEDIELEDISTDNSSSPWTESEFITYENGVLNNARNSTQNLPNYVDSNLEGAVRHKIKEKLNLLEWNCDDDIELDGAKIFQLFFNDEIMNKFMDSTNSFGAKKFDNKWRNVSFSEFKAFLAVIMLLGIVQYPNREMAWDHSLGCTLIKLIMKEHRFTEILRCWHFRDVTDLTDEDFKKMKEDDPFYATTELMKVLCLKYSEYYRCGQFIDIDEQCLGWQGRHKCRCFNPNKPEKYHLKIFALNCSKTGYQIDSYFYHGASEVHPRGIPATQYPVDKLLQSNIFWNKGHVLFTDNWYGSIGALKICAERGIDYITTMKTRRTGIPNAGIFPSKGNGVRERGSMMIMEQTLGIMEKKAYFIAWQDNKPVHILSTIPSGISKCKRWKSIVTNNSRESWTQVELDIPDVIELYNQGMGGTDSIDQRLAYYRPKIKTISWIPKVLIHLMNVTVFNSFVIYRDLVSKTSDKRCILLDFIRNLATSLAGDYLQLNQQVHQNVASNVMKKSQWLNDRSRLVGKHFPRLCKVGRPNTRNMHHTSEQGFCMRCNKHIRYKCITCKVFLCIESQSNEETCFEKFHCQVKFL